MDNNTVNNTDPRVLELEELKKSINTLKGKLTTLETNKKQIEKDANELIATTIYQKKQELERSYDEILKEAEQRLKVAEKEKEDERKKNIGKLVEKNTRSIRENNTYLNNEIKRLLKENKLPGFINSGVYMSIWNPTTMKENIGRVVACLIVLAIPTLISFVTMSDTLNKTFGALKIFIIILIYALVLLVAIGLWFLLDKMTKKNPDVLKEVKEIRKNIKDNKTEIDKITKAANSKSSDEQFDYTKLDRDIEANKLEVENYRNKKKNAMDNFINNTQDEIERKIGDEAKKNISIVDNEIENVKSELSILQKKHDDLKISIVEGSQIDGNSV